MSGRVVPIKDVKTYIRAAGILRKDIPDLQALILGPTEEDEQYFEECRSIVKRLGLEKTVIFTGRVKLTDWLGRIIDRPWRDRCSMAIKERVRRYYDKIEIDRIYRALYDEYRDMLDQPTLDRRR